MAVGYVGSAVKAAQSSVGSFNFDSSLGTGGRAGLVFVVTYANSGVPIDTGVTWNSAPMTQLYYGADTNTEPAAVRVYFLDNISNGTVTVSRTNNTVVTSAFAVVVSAASATIASQVRTAGGDGTVGTNANTSTSGTAASGPIAVNDNSPGTNSMRFSVSFTGAATPLSADATSSTSLQTDDRTAFGSTLVRETTAGQGSRNVGVATGTTDDWAVAAIAVSEKIDTNPQPSAASLTLTGDTPTVAASDNKTSLPTAASLTLTGATPTVATTDNVTVSPDAAALVLTGATPAVATPVTSLPTEASLVLAGATPAVATPVAVLPDAGALVITPSTPTVAAAQAYVPDAAALVLVGDTPAMAAAQTYVPDAAALALAGGTPQVSAAQAYVPDPAALALTAATPDVAAAQTYVPDPAALVLSGATPSVAAGAALVVLPDAAALALTGATPTVAVQELVTVLPDPAALVLTPATPTVARTANVLAFPTPASLHLTGAVPAVTGVTPPELPGGGLAPYRIEPILDIERDDEDVILAHVA